MAVGVQVGIAHDRSVGSALSVAVRVGVARVVCAAAVVVAVS